MDSQRHTQTWNALHYSEQCNSISGCSGEHCPKCCVSGSQASFHRVTAQYSLGQGARLLHICCLSDWKEHRSGRNEVKSFCFCNSLLVFCTVFVFAQREQYLHFLLLKSRTSLLFAECRIWTSFRNYHRKKIHCCYFETLFVSMQNPAGFIYMCLFVISLFSANPTKINVFCAPIAGSAASVC